ncbi:MAG: helix-turn-helix transcriptional regulator [Candidatus Aenigmatarchaeota archaeon]
MNGKLGQFLKKVRKEKNLTLRFVEKRTGISNAYLSQVENNKILKPSPIILYKLAKCYKISYGYLMMLAGYPLPSQKKKSYLNEEINNIFNELTLKEKEMVLKYMQFLKSRRGE